MTRNELMCTVLIAVSAGWTGGVLSGPMLRADPVVAQEISPVVTAEEFRVVGKDGKVRSVIGARSDGSTSTAFYDLHGKIRAEMGVNAAGVAELALYDQEGKQRQPHGFAYMFVLPNGGPRLSLIGDTANLTIASERLAGYATLKIDPDNNPVLSLEGDNKGAALLTMLEDGFPSLTLYDPEGYRRAALEVKEHRVPGKEARRKSGLTLYDPNETVIWSTP
jgi:hypothetical protein